MKVFMYADGYVRIKIWGNVERFLVLCSRKQMKLWQIEVQGKYVFANMRLKDFYNCRKIARKAGIRAVVVERHGLPFLMPRILKRSFWIVGFVLFIVLWGISTNMLLHIKIQGNYSISDDVMMDFLEQNQIRIGMWKKDIPLEELEKAIREEFDLVTWTSGKLDGTVLIIDMKENEKLFLEEVSQKTEYGSSLYATVDGVIDSIYVRKGTPLVKKGMEVKAGDKLVDGSVPVYYEDQSVAFWQYYEADADIGIETVVPVKYSLDAVYVEKQYTGRHREGNYFSIGQKVYRNGFGEHNFLYKDLVLQQEKSVTLGNLVLGFGKFEIYEYVKVEKAYSEQEEKKLLEEEFEKNNIILREKGVQILEKDVTIDIIMEQWILSGTMKVIMPAFESRTNEISEDVNESEGI